MSLSRIIHHSHPTYTSVIYVNFIFMCRIVKDVGLKTTVQQEAVPTIKTGQ